MKIKLLNQKWKALMQYSCQTNFNLLMKVLIQVVCVVIFYVCIRNIQSSFKYFLFEKLFMQTVSFQHHKDLTLVGLFACPFLTLQTLQFVIIDQSSQILSMQLKYTVLLYVFEIVVLSRIVIFYRILYKEQYIIT